MRKEYLLYDLKWSLPAGAALGALLAAFQSDFYLNAWLAFSLLSAAGLWTLACMWRWAGGERGLALVIILAFSIRLLAGIGLASLLPVFGYADSEPQRAGFVFYDAFKRDGEAWALAASDAPLWSAIGSDQFVSDQYGGLLMVSAGVYRLLSPDAHRPELIVLLAALAGALAIPFAYTGITALWGRQVALTSAWILALYPESVFLGGAQMREPFLILFISMALWGFSEWQAWHRRAGWVWFALGVAGLLLFSPGVVLPVLVAFAGWMLLASSKRSKPWLALAVIAGVLVLVVFVLAPILGGGMNEFGGGGPLKLLTGWMLRSSQWDFQLLEESSGMVQMMMEHLPENMRMPFLVGYGILQPLWPAVVAEPAAAIWKIINLLRASGWYMLLPMLIYGFVAAYTSKDANARRVFVWLDMVVWAWIVVAAMRGGADQWDNPRYRTIMLPFEAMIAAFAWHAWREWHDRWLPRIVAAEVVSLLVILLWYASRYNLFFKASIMVYLVIAITASFGVVLFDIFYMRWKQRRA